MQINQEDRIGGRPQRAKRWPLALAFGIFAAVVAAVVLFSNDLDAYLNFGRTNVSAALAGKPSEKDFGPLYQQLGIAPLDVKVAYRANVLSALTALRQEFCDKHAIYDLTVALENADARRPAAEALIGFAKECHNAEGELYTAADIYFGLSEFSRTVEITDQLLAANTYNGQIHFLRAQALQNLQRWPEALQDYIDAVELTGDPKFVSADAYFSLAHAYAQLGRYCEAITPIQTWVLVDPVQHDTPQTKHMIEDFLSKGNCESDYAKGAESFPRSSNGTLHVRAEINHTPGNFILDTGASFATLTDNFAHRAGVNYGDLHELQMTTAHGTGSAALGSPVNIKLGHLEADRVGVLVQKSSYGEGVDGLLGMSLLARFDVVLTDKELKLQPKHLKQ